VERYNLFSVSAVFVFLDFWVMAGGCIVKIRGIQADYRTIKLLKCIFKPCLFVVCFLGVTTHCGCIFTAR
jgi:hypothetical protein